MILINHYSMLAQILNVIAQPNNQKDSYIEGLSQQNQQMIAQIDQLEADLSYLPLKDIADYVGEHSNVSYTYVNPGEKIEQVFSIIEQFHAVFATSQKENKRCEYLLEQIKLILELSQNYDLLGTLELYQEPSSQTNLNYLKQLSESISQQILQYQNQQNINKFKAEHEEICQEYVNVIEFYKRFKELVGYLYESSIKANYQVRQGVFKVKRQHFKALWTQDSRFHQEFLSQLTRFLEKFIIYDINDRQYTMSYYTLQSNPETLQIARSSKLVFDSNEVSLHYESLIANFSTMHTFFNELQLITPQEKHALISSAKKTILERIKSYVQYLLPYLTMELRRKLLDQLSVRQSSESLNIYQLLVSLRMCGKDADMLVKTIQLIITKVREDERILSTVIKFIEIAKQNKKNYHMNFFICNQMIEELEEGEVTTQIADSIKKLFIIREEMRIKIHHVDGKE